MGKAPVQLPDDDNLPSLFLDAEVGIGLRREGFEPPCLTDPLYDPTTTSATLLDSQQLEISTKLPVTEWQTWDSNLKIS